MHEKRIDLRTKSSPRGKSIGQKFIYNHRSLTKTRIISAFKTDMWIRREYNYMNPPRGIDNA